MKIDFFKSVSFDTFVDTVCGFLGDIIKVDGSGSELRILHREGKDPFTITMFPNHYNVLNEHGQPVLGGIFIGPRKQTQ